MFTGGFDAAVTPLGMAALMLCARLSHRNDDPAGASRPFDANRDGFGQPEVGALLVLEDLEFALSRGAQPLAEVLGYASTSDAIHLTAPDPDGAGAAQCMRFAMQRVADNSPGCVRISTPMAPALPSATPAETPRYPACSVTRLSCACQFHPVHDRCT